MGNTFGDGESSAVGMSRVVLKAQCPPLNKAENNACLLRGCRKRPILRILLARPASVPAPIAGHAEGVTDVHTGFVAAQFGVFPLFDDYPQPVSVNT